MMLRVLALAVATVLGLAASAAAQDPSWTIVRPDITWDNHWKVEPSPQPLFSVLDEPIYHDQRPAVSGDRAAATSRKARFAVGVSDVAGGAGFAGGEAWVYIGIRKRTIVDIAIRTRRDGRVTILSSRKRVTPPIVIEPE